MIFHRMHGHPCIRGLPMKRCAIPGAPLTATRTRCRMTSMSSTWPLGWTASTIRRMYCRAWFLCDCRFSFLLFFPSDAETHLDGDHWNGALRGESVALGSLGNRHHASVHLSVSLGTPIGMCLFYVTPILHFPFELLSTQSNHYVCEMIGD